MLVHWVQFDFTARNTDQNLTATDFHFCFWEGTLCRPHHREIVSIQGEPIETVLGLLTIMQACEGFNMLQFALETLAVRGFLCCFCIFPVDTILCTSSGVQETLTPQVPTI